MPGEQCSDGSAVGRPDSYLIRWCWPQASSRRPAAHSLSLPTNEVKSPTLHPKHLFSWANRKCFVHIKWGFLLHQGGFAEGVTLLFLGPLRGNFPMGGWWWQLSPPWETLLYLSCTILCSNKNMSTKSHQ